MLRPLIARAEFVAADARPEQQLELVLLDRSVQQLCVEWSVQDLTGLLLDGEPATVHSLLEKAPELLVQELLVAIQGQLGLTPDERKN